MSSPSPKAAEEAALGGVRGAGPPLEPDEQPELQIELVKTASGLELDPDDLTEAETEKLEAELWKSTE